jgi:mannose/fructose/N-acetylgalactosamine-specific phosphotransferase system component IIC
MNLPKIGRTTGFGVLGLGFALAMYHRLDMTFVTLALGLMTAVTHRAVKQDRWNRRKSRTPTNCAEKLRQGA